MTRIVLLIVLATTLSSCATSGSKRLTKQELTALLGPNSQSTLRWSKTDGPDFTVYHGESSPPLSGGVGFYLGYQPSFQPEAKDTSHRSRLGVYTVVWHRRNQADGSLYQTTLISLPDQSYIHVWVYGSHESDLGTLIQELATLPRFNQRVHRSTP